MNIKLYVFVWFVCLHFLGKLFLFSLVFVSSCVLLVLNTNHKILHPRKVNSCRFVQHFVKREDEHAVNTLLYLIPLGTKCMKLVLYPKDKSNLEQPKPNLDGKFQVNIILY